MAEENIDTTPPAEASQEPQQQEQTTTPEASAERSPDYMSIQELLGHDADDHAAPETEGKPTEGGKQKDEKPTAPAQPETQKPTEPSPDIAALTAAIKDLTTQKDTQDKAPDAPKAPAPQYAPKVPPAIMAALSSEVPEERAEGMNVLLGSVMNRIYDDVVKLVQTQVIPSIPTIMEQHSALGNERKRIHDEFYGEYKALDKPEVKPLVQMMALQLAQGMGKNFKGFTPEFKAALVQRLEAAGIAVQSPAPTPTPPAKKPGQGFQPGTTTRTAAEKTLADEIADVISF